jgi:hypothetical protein
MPVRSFTERDIPQVADLYWSVLRERTGPAPAGVHSFLQELYFANPWIDSSIPSLVYDEKGRIAGFLGVVPRKMSLSGQSLRVAFGGNFAVHPEFRSTLAGLHLLRTYLDGRQDLSQTDSANNTSRALLERLGFTTIMPFSVHWVRPIRPCRAATFALARFAANALSTSFEFAARPFCGALDSLAVRLSSSPFHLAEPKLRATDLDVETLLSCLKEFASGYALRPEYDPYALQWLFSFMQRMKGHGKELRSVALTAENNKTVGWYVYYGTPDGVGEVVQLGGSRFYMRAILDHLFYDAWKSGVALLHGRVDQGLMAEFSEKNCFFTCRGGWMVAHSSKREILDVLNNGDAFLSRLDGEWCLAYGC